MDLPDFSSLWEANNTLGKLERSFRERRGGRGRGNHAYRGRKRPIDTYYSDGICGISFGIAIPEFSNPLKTCCDQHFFTEEEFHRHETEHVQCPVDLCGLSLHPNIMSFHKEIAHSSTLQNGDSIFSRLQSGLGDKSIICWRESRKRNYPTFERIQAKIRETGYRIERGQVLMTRQFGSLNARKNFELHTGHTGNMDSIAKEQSTELEILDELPKITKSDQISPSSPSTTIHLSPTSSLHDDYKEEEEDNDEEEEEEKEGGEEKKDVNKSEKVEDEEPASPFMTLSENETNEKDHPDEEEIQKVEVSLEVHRPLRGLVTYGCDSDTSWDDNVVEDDAAESSPNRRMLCDNQSPPSTDNLITQLSHVQPKFSAPAVSNKIASGEEVEKILMSGRRKDQFLRESGGRSRRTGRSKRGGGRGRRRRELKEQQKENVEGEDDEMEKRPRGVAAVFASNPVVQLMSRRRTCMRTPALINKRPTLLQMLLAGDMRQERNQLMQCVRFVVQKDFFS